MRFVAGRGAMAKRMAALWRRAIGKLLLARALQRSTIGKQPLPERKEEPLLERRATAGKKSHCQKGKVRSATAGKKGLQRSNGLVSFFDAPLMQIIPIFVIW